MNATVIPLRKGRRSADDAAATAKPSAGRSERGPSVLQNPPPKTRFARYIKILQDIDDQNEPGHLSDVPAVRAYSGAVLLRTLPLHEVPPIVVRELLVEPGLRERGMPAGPIPGWADSLTDDRVFLLQQDAYFEHKRKSRLPSRRQGGHPPPKSWPFAVIAAFYIEPLARLPGARDNAHFEWMAHELDLNRGNIRTAVRNFRSKLGSLPPQESKLLTLMAMGIHEILQRRLGEDVLNSSTTAPVLSNTSELQDRVSEEPRQ